MKATRDCLGASNRNRLWLAYIVVLFGCAPVFPLSLASMAFDDAASQRCGVSVAKPTETAWGTTFQYYRRTLRQCADLVVSGVCLEQRRDCVSHCLYPLRTGYPADAHGDRQFGIDNQVLLQEVADFTRDCYGYSRSRLFTNRPQLDKAQSHDASSIGSNFFLDTPGYYDTDRSRRPRVNWPYDENRDVSLPRLENGAGYPTCKQWWSDSGVGLRGRLIEQVDPSLLTQLNGWLTGRLGNEIEDATLRDW